MLLVLLFTICIVLRWTESDLNLELSERRGSPGTFPVGPIASDRRYFDLDTFESFDSPDNVIIFDTFPTLD